jgi:hypothetical protein
VTWYVCTIGKASPSNWELCKQVNLYGIPGIRGHPRRPRAQAGDHLLVWQGGKGYIAEAAVTGPARIPRNNNEAPWPGGTYRFSYVVPIEVVLEVESPLKLSFVGNEQTGTGLPKGKFQLSFAPIPDKAATYVSNALHAKRAAETLTGREEVIQTAGQPNEARLPPELPNRCAAMIRQADDRAPR